MRSPLRSSLRASLSCPSKSARNVANFIRLMLDDGAVRLDWDDALLAKTAWPGPPPITIDDAGARA